MYWFSCPLSLPSNEDVICLFKLECLNYNIMPFSKVNMYVDIRPAASILISVYCCLPLMLCIMCCGSKSTRMDNLRRDYKRQAIINLSVGCSSLQFMLYSYFLEFCLQPSFSACMLSICYFNYT